MRKKNNLTLTSFWVALVLLPATFCSLAGQQVNPPAKELVQYNLDAEKTDLNDSQTQKKTVRAGGAAREVTGAIAYQRATPNQRVNGDPSTAAAKTGATTAAPDGQAGKSSASPAALAPPAGAVAAPSVPPSNTSDNPSDTKPKAVANRGVPDDYQIGAGDVLQINIWKELDVPNVVVRFDGKITMPLIKDVAVAGLTPRQAEKLITEQLSDMLDTPDVTVIVAGMSSKRIYFIGAVKTQAPIAYTYRMTVMQGISEAGGLTDYAKRKKIYILRNENNKQYKFPFDYDAVLNGKRMDLNIPLMPGDTVVVP